MSDKTTIFLDTQDMEERYCEELYKEYLEKENKQLKEKVGELTQSLNEQMKLTNEENLDCSKYAIKNNQLKEVIEEVREYIKYYLLDNSWFKDSQKEFEKLLQILDKVKVGDKNE